MDSLLPSELLLLSQAIVLHGSAQPELVTRALQARMLPSRASLIATPQACIQLINEMLAAEGLDAHRLAEVKRPNARPSIKLARKHYTARLAELKDKLAAQEELMKTLLLEDNEIQSGAWDAKLTQSYELVTDSEEATQALYKHKYSAGTIEDAQNEAKDAQQSEEGQSVTEPTQSDTTLLPKEEAASPAKELHFADEVITMPESAISMDQDSASPQDQREGTATSALQDVPEEDEEVDTPQKLEEVEEEHETQGDDEVEHPQEREASASRQTRRSLPPPPAQASSASSNSKGSAPERRSSSRVSRSSIANLSEIIPSTSSDAAEVTITSPPPPIPAAEEVTSPSRNTIAPSSESMDLDMASMPMDREDSKDSTAGPTSTTAGPAKRGRPARKSSVPLVTTKDANKRKRTTTPQAQNRATSPAPSERSKSKRIKTEEPESGLGTPVESDRTPGNSDASAIRRFRNSAPHLISQMISSVNSTYFKEPVKKGEAKNYFEIIKKPMDLKTLLQSVKNGKVTNSAEFTRDLTLIFANAIMYNGQEHHVGQDAVNMWREAQGLLRVLEAAEQRVM